MQSVTMKYTVRPIHPFKNKTPNSELTVHSVKNHLLSIYYVLDAVLEPSPGGYKEDFNTLKDRDM